MISFLVGNRIANSFESSSKIDPTLKISSCFSVLETTLYVCAIIGGLGIITNSLPSSLSFFKDQMTLGNVMIASGGSLLAIPGIFFPIKHLVMGGRQGFLNI